MSNFQKDQHDENTEKSFIELIFGKEYLEKEKAFQEELRKIEEKYIAFFIARKPKFEFEEHDKLYHHYVKITEGDKIIFQ